MKTFTVEKLSWHLIWIFGLLELITVPLVAWLPTISSLQTKSPWQGGVVGFTGVLVLFLILNNILPGLNVRIAGERLIKISVLPAAFWNTLLLALIFGIQKLTGLLPVDPWIPRYIFAGFTSVFGAVWITGSVYRWVNSLLPIAGLWLKTNQQHYTVRNIRVFKLALTAGVYEAIALPLILLWQKAESLVPLAAGLTGLAGGMLGAGVVVLLFNNTRIFHFSITLEENS